MSDLAGSGATSHSVPSPAVPFAGGKNLVFGRLFSRGPLQQERAELSPCREPYLSDHVLRSMTQAVRDNMRGRVAQLRAVAKMARDPAVAAIALSMADDIEADIRELEANAGPTIQIEPPRQE